MNSEPIGIFDSGVGGLTVLREVSKMLPAENIIYLGDTARVPYGIRSPETVIRYSFECTDFLLRQNIKLLVVACNTVSAVGIDKICQKVAIPVVGVIEPGAITAVNSTKNKRIGIIGTEATISSSAYTRAIKAINRDVEVFGLPCPLFVPLVEEGWTEGTITRLIAEKYLQQMMNRGVDTLVLGCTHYPLLKGVINEVMDNVLLIDSAIETARVVKDMLKGHETTGDWQGSVKFYVTDSPEKFVRVGGRFLEREIDKIERIEL